MAFTSIQNTGAAGTNSATFGATLTAGHLVVVRASQVYAGAPLGSSSVADSAGNTYTLAVSRGTTVSFTTYVVEIWYAIVATGGPSVAVTYTPAGGNNSAVSISIAEYSFVGSTPVLDGTANATGISGTSLSSGSFTTTGPSDLVVGAGSAKATGQTWTAGSGFTTLYSTGGSTGVSSLCAEDQLGVAAGSIAAAMADSVSTNWTCVGAAFATGLARTLATAPGAFALTGQAASYGLHASIIGTKGVFVLTGRPATPSTQRLGSTAPGAFTLTGRPAQMQARVSIVTAKGVFALAGFNRILSTQRIVAASPGAFVETGRAATFGARFSLSTARGSFVLTGQVAGLSKNRVTLLNPVAGSFVLTGKTATLSTQRALAAARGVFTLTGRASLIQTHISLATARGTFILTGQPANLGAPRPILYHIYGNTGAGDPINYASPIGATPALTWFSADLAYPGTWSFGVRGSNIYGEEQNLDAAVTIVLDGAGRDVSNLPAPPAALSAVARASGAVRVDWNYPSGVAPRRAPTGFHVYVGASAPPSYSAPAATVAAGAGLASRYSAMLLGLSGGVRYQVGVRAFNATGEETNTAVKAVTALTAGPRGVVGLTATATSTKG